jgi:hypothetical protein
MELEHSARCAAAFGRTTPGLTLRLTSVSHIVILALRNVNTHEFARATDCCAS